jgi:hypothetical protein
MKLTAAQYYAIEEMREFLISRTRKKLLITGFAGSGKTTVIAEFINSLDMFNIMQTVALCPTHPACDNFAERVKNSVDVRTIASFVAKRWCRQRREFVYSQEEVVRRCRLVVVDEVSMISKDELDKLLEIAGNSMKIIFVGDPGQLSPVGEKISPIWNITNIQHIHLDEIVRYSGALTDVAESVRNDGQKIYPYVTTNDGTIEVLPLISWISRAVELLKEDYNSCRILAYRNKRVDEYNSLVRMMIHGENVPTFIKDDILLVRKVFQEDDNIIYRVSEELSVISWDGIIHCDTFEDIEIEYYELYVSSKRKPRARKIVTPLKTSYYAVEQIIQKKLERAQRTAKWSDFYKFCSKWSGRIQHGFALTVHRSQGSTIPYVFVDINDISRNRDELDKLQYVAITRTSKKLYILG